MANKLVAANDAAWAVVNNLFAADIPVRNPGGFKAPAAKAEDGLGHYIAFVDDKNSQVIDTMMGPVYDLQISPKVVIAFDGKTKDERQAAAWAKLDLLVAALRADVKLGGAADYAEIGEPEEVDADGDTKWMAGGLEIPIDILFSAPTKAG